MDYQALVMLIGELYGKLTLANQMVADLQQQVAKSNGKATSTREHARS